MSDIFDEVDDILNEVSADLSESGPESHEAEKNFNESELMDIMAEIESLEQEFEPAEAETKKYDLQSEIDRELEMSLVEKEEEELMAAEAPKTLSFEKKAEPKAAPKAAPKAEPKAEPVEPIKSSEISFEAHGQMNLNLAFKVGEETASLSIDPKKGLVVKMSGVELCINQNDGCKVTMENGVNFTIPLTPSESGHKKKIA